MLKLPIWGNSEKEETHTAAPYIKADRQPGDSCSTSPLNKRQAVTEKKKTCTFRKDSSTLLTNLFTVMDQR